MEHLCQVGLTASSLIDPPRLPQSVYAYGLNDFAWEHLVGRNTNVMGYPFLEGTWAVSSLLFFLYLSCISQPLFQHCPLSIQLTLQEYEELIWHAGNLKLEVTEYSRQLYGSEGAGDDDDDDYDDDDNGGDGDGGLEPTPSHQSRMRHSRSSCRQTDRHRHKQHSIAFFFFFSFQHTFLHFGFDLRNWVVFKNIFHIYAFIWDMHLNYKLMETLCNSTILDL